MLSTSLRWGAISGGVMLVAAALSFLFIGRLDASTYGIAEIAGYTSIILGLAVIWFAVARRYSGDAAAASLWDRIRLGLGIAFVAGLIFAAFDTFYTLVLNPGFMQSYYDYYLSTLPVQSGPEYDRLVAELESQRAMFGSPLAIFFVMAVTVWAAGIVISVLVALIHKYLVGGRAKAA